MRCKTTVILFFALCLLSRAFAQDDKALLSSTSLLDTSIKIKTDTAIVSKKSTPLSDTLAKLKHDPRKATIRSAIVPGWGQVYNKQSWKLPLVYAAIGIPAYAYFYNDKWYKRTRDAYEIVVKGQTENYNKIDPQLQALIPYPQSLQFYRNDFRKNRDYSILFFLLGWGLNVVDATVFGHLKDFDVSDDLSLNISPRYNFDTKTTGMSLALTLKSTQRKPLPLF